MQRQASSMGCCHPSIAVQVSTWFKRRPHASLQDGSQRGPRALMDPPHPIAQSARPYRCCQRAPRFRLCVTVHVSRGERDLRLTSLLHTFTVRIR
eukprot:4613276-Prymnesium_polylepis.1